MAESKYSSLDMPNAMPPVTPPNQEKIKKAVDIFLGAGVFCI
jgi:hypothetical protein